MLASFTASFIIKHQKLLCYKYYNLNVLASCFQLLVVSCRCCHSNPDAYYDYNYRRKSNTQPMATDPAYHMSSEGSMRISSTAEKQYITQAVSTSRLLAGGGIPRTSRRSEQMVRKTQFYGEKRWLSGKRIRSTNRVANPSANHRPSLKQVIGLMMPPMQNTILSYVNLIGLPDQKHCVKYNLWYGSDFRNAERNHTILTSTITLKSRNGTANWNSLARLHPSDYLQCLVIICSAR